MAAIAPIVLLDGAAVSRTFNVSNATADTARWEERTSSQFIGYQKATLTIRRPVMNQKLVPQKRGKKPVMAVVADPNRNIKVIFKVEVPVLETVGTNSSGYLAVPVVSYRTVSENTFTLPERCTLDDRKTILNYARLALADTTLQNAVWNFDMPY